VESTWEVCRGSEGIKGGGRGNPFGPFWQVVKNCLFPEVPQEVQPKVRAHSMGQVGARGDMSAVTANLSPFMVWVR